MKKQKKENKVIARISAFMGYALAMALCVFFALYMSAPAGWTFFYMLAAAPLFSLILLAVTYFIKPLEITASADSATVYKNEEFFYNIKIKNKSILPVPSVIIKTNMNGGMEKPFSVCVYTRGVTEFKIGCKATVWGPLRCGITEIRLADFLNIISLPIYKDDGTYASAIRVFPDIPDVPCDSPLIRSTAESIRFCDDCEDTKESDSFNFTGGMPGYTHREYVEGDPIKRINWKLSSKKENYMVRLDDETEAMQQVIVLDSKCGLNRKDDERGVEGVLAVVFSMLRLGFDSVVFFNTKHGFIPFEITEQGDLSALRTAFAEYEYETSPCERLPIDELSEKKYQGIMLCSPCPDGELSAAADTAAEYGISVTLISASSEHLPQPPYWQLDNDYGAEFIS
ncbi:MAG: DUF58 domain-containing protein [Oscillospiraceae bacterium]|nr:DUF58 domain-containing protein [Oscillospiraceae bacterium]